MAVLEKELQDKIDAKRFGANTHYKTNKEEYFKLKLEAWSLYPEPKNNWNEAYSLAKDFFRIYLFEGSHNEAKEWLNRMIENNNNLHLFDFDLAHNEGKYYYEIGDYQTAYEKWKYVTKEAGFRYFENEKPEYLDFYKHPEKYMK